MEPPSWFWAILLAWLVGRDVINSSRPASSKEKKVESKRSQLGLLTTATLVVLAVACLLPTITSTLSDSVPDMLEVVQSPPSEEEHTGQRFAAPEAEDDVARIQNATLGFQKVFVVNLPDRTDKRDALSLVGSLTGIKLDWIRALRGGLTSPTRHCLWAWTVKGGETEALDRGGPPHSPYGDDWDILWLGHCGETFPERIPGHEVVDLASARYTYYAMRDDETMPPLANTSSWINGDLRREPGTRWVHFSGGPTCSAGYALSQSGARKVLHALSVGGTLIAQLDNAMADLCRDHTPWDAISSTRVSSVTNKPPPPGYAGARMRCLSVTPAVISQHKPRGRRAAESDIESVENGHEIREKGESPNLVWSARLNVQNLILGLPMENQFEAQEGFEELDA
ncbi:hypothetical protein PG989_010728 [Apiospora arundinis]